ncbi:MAG: (2Fe-2S)-binding protein, partial [Deltaproteobacteria bacterium]|nr:(2Fe-2S)-binding protein [Deltaproteobacteria bacterium]
MGLTIDGEPIEVAAGTSLWDAARSLGREIPTLCHDPKLRPVGVCRMCVVEVEGERVMTAACVRQAEQGMVVHTGGEKIDRCRRGLSELLLAEQPETSAREITTGDDALLALAREQGAAAPYPAACANPSEAMRPSDDSSVVIAVDHQACILCDRCIRACNEVQHNDVMGRTGKGYETRISFDFDVPMGESSCVSCGECAAACPTGALVDKEIGTRLRRREDLETVDSICPYCGVGCAIRYHTDPNENRISFAEGRESPVSQGRLCVKGRYGHDYATHPQRLTTPLIRIDYPKRALSTEVQNSDRRRRKPGGLVDQDEVMPAFREASWDEALDRVAQGLLKIREGSGSHALAGFGSAKCSNEEAYLFQKLVRAAFGTNNVDHCTRLCHASS